MVDHLLPLPCLLNEESFSCCENESAFVEAAVKLIETIRAMRMYGFAVQVGCSAALMDRICYGSTSFYEWLRLPDGANAKTNRVRKVIRGVITKVPRLEEGYPDLRSDLDFDLIWKGTRIYVNQLRTLPAFVVARCFGLPTVSLGVGDFSDKFVHEVVIQEFKGSEIDERVEEIRSFSNVGQIEACDAYLGGLIQDAVVDERRFSRVRAEMLPDLIFSHEVEIALCQHKVSFRTVPVLAALMRLQRAITKAHTRNLRFEDAYGRLNSLAMNESETVRQSFPNTRQFTWDDGRRLCFPHVKIGNKFRIHFLPDTMAGKVYVGYMGNHLLL